jgi:hypothetical protein
MIRNRSMWRRHASVGLAVLVTGLVGCWQSSPPGQGNVKVTDITVGRTLAPDDTIAADSQTTSFWTTDTFYVSVATEGSAASATLKARWTYQDGTVAGESSKTISPTGAMVTALQAASPDRWKEGDYKVEIFIDGASAGSKDLTTR